jgi:hypothetical protein
MDTTSHNFTWQMDTLGVTASSLSDVAIINDTLAFAVGEMYLRDSTGQVDPTPYNLAMWNGHRWEVERVTVIFRGSPVTVPLEGIFVHSATNIWLAGSIPIHGNGTSWVGYDIQALVGAGATVSRMWGTPQEMYFVGRAGNIIHYNGSTWQRVESGTTLDVRDIWGATNARSGVREILALASTNTPQVQGSMVFRITGNSATPISTTGMSPDMHSTWFIPERRYYVVGAGIHQKRMLSDSAWSAYAPGVVTRYFSGGVRGQDVNDVFVVGSFGEVVHFNGQSWYRYFSDLPLPSGYLGFVAIKNNLIMSTGQVNGQRGIVLIGRR